MLEEMLISWYRTEEGTVTLAESVDGSCWAVQIKGENGELTHLGGTAC